MRAYILQAMFWNHIGDKRQSVEKTISSGFEVVRLLQSTEKAFKELLILNPRSVTLLRSYAQFLIDVANDQSEITC